MDEQQQPVFPAYESPVNPTGHVYAHPKQVSPLMKAIKLHLKPRVKMKGPKVRTWKKKHQFY